MSGRDTLQDCYIYIAMGGKGRKENVDAIFLHYILSIFQKTKESTGVWEQV